MSSRETGREVEDETTSGGLLARGLTLSFPGQQVPALDDVDLRVADGRVLALLGPSGCGKSTALRVIAGLEDAAGLVSYDGVDLTRTPAHRRGFSLMFQDGQLFGHLSVFENVAYGLRRRRVPKSDVAPRVERLLDLVGLSGFGDRHPATLSGGQQQRVALARALAPRPRLLLLDEPLSALDRALRERLAADLRNIVQAEGVTALFVTHDQDEALTVADDVALMRNGRIVQSGPVGEVWAAPADADAARFMGYANIFDDADSRRLGLPDGRWAVRRTGWRYSDGPDEQRGSGGSSRLAASDRSEEPRTQHAQGSWRGVVTRVSGAGDLVNLTVALDALNGREIEAAVLAGPGSRALREEAVVHLGLDTDRAARLP